MLRRLSVVLCSVLLCTAFTTEEMLQKTEQETRARGLFMQLRCVSCDGQVIANSDAKLSVSMRQVIRKKIQNGESDQAIIQFFVLRYGTDILATSNTTRDRIILYLLPMILVSCIAWFLWRRNISHAYR